MKVVMTLKNGLILELPLDSVNELEEIHTNIRSFGKFFAWKQRIWVNKKEVASYELVSAPLKSEETI
jgi:hypothetical protein